MSMIIQLIIVMILLELIEANLHRASTLGGMIEGLYTYYNKSIFLFFMAHPTFYFVLWVSISFKIFNFSILIILFFKAMDIFFKIEMIKQHCIEKQVDKELATMLEMPMASWMGLLGLFTYVPLLFMAISS